MAGLVGRRNEGSSESPKEAEGPVSLVDTHCHLQDVAFDADRDEVLQRAFETVAWLVVVGDDLESSRNAVALCGPRVFASVGLHPYHAEHGDEELWRSLRSLAEKPGVVAIGEAGFDYSRYSTAPRQAQQKALEVQLSLASELGLPVVIHNRPGARDGGGNAINDVSAVLGAHFRGLPGGVMHCFDPGADATGGAQFVERCLSWGFHISFAGNVTFPKATVLRQAACRVPLDRLLVETDSPYLAPQPVRGKRCEPGHVSHTAEMLAGLHGVPLAELARRTSENAARLFGIPSHG